MSDEKKGRTSAEWLTFAVSAAVLLVVMGLVALQIPTEDKPPLPVARITSFGEERGESYVVVVEVENRGDTTAENIQVSVSLETEEATVEGDQTIDFLAGEEKHEIEFLFDENPSSGELDVRVTGYGIP
jgi:uncharacterized protein (TIGR02588 family)